MNTPQETDSPPSPHAPSIAHLAATTPARDWSRGRLTGRLDWQTVIARADLPDPIARLVQQVVKQSRLWKLERADLASELCAHFTDGLEEGNTKEQLMHSFGDPKKASALIRRAKKRNRHWTHRAFTRTIQGLAAILLAGLFLYAILAWRFFNGEPDITRNFTAEYNETIEQIPENDRAYDLYIEATIALEPLPESLLGVWPDIAPEHPAYQDATAYLEHSARAISLIHKAAARPRMGETLSNAADPRITEMLRKRHPEYTEQTQQPKENPAMVTVALPLLAHLRTMYRLLAFDAHTAARNRKSDQVVQNVTTMLGLAEHAAEAPTLISSLVGLAIYHGTLWTTAQIIHDYPDLFSSDQLRNLAHRHAAFMNGNPRVNLAGERWFFEDFVQRVYTDDGHGNGHITAAGLRLLFSQTIPETDMSSQFGPPPLAPIAAALIADRADMMAKHDELMTQVERDALLPMWKYGSDDWADLGIQMLDNDLIQRTRYFPLTMLMPAFGRAIQTVEKTIQQRDALLTGIALELHKRNHGDYPETLDALVPAYLPQVPPDRFTGKPIHYALIDGLPRLWSVGADRNDDGGIAPVGDRTDENRWVPKAEARQNEQIDPERYDGDWILWPIVYAPIKDDLEG